MLFKNIVVALVFVSLLTPGASYAASKKTALDEQRVVNMTDYDKSSLGSIRIQPPAGWTLLNEGDDVRIYNQDKDAFISLGVDRVRPKQNDILMDNLINVRVGQTTDGIIILEKSTLKIKSGSVPYIVGKDWPGSSTKETSHGAIVPFKKGSLMYVITLVGTNEKSWKENRAIMEKSLKTLQVSPRAAKIPPLKVTTKLAPTYTSNPNISGFKASIKPPLGWVSEELPRVDWRNGGIGFWFGEEGENYGQFSIELAESDPTIAAREFARMTTNTTIAGVPGYKTEERISAASNNLRGSVKQSIYFLKNGSLYVIEMQGTENNRKKYNAIIEKSLKTLKISS